MDRHDASLMQDRPFQIGPRQGFWGWWLDFVAPPRTPETTASPQLREKLRKAELIGYFLFIFVFFAFFDLLLALLSWHILSMIDVFLFMIFLGFVGWINRKGRTSLAAGLLIGVIVISIMFVITFVLPGKGGADLFPTYDFFIYPIMIGGLFMPRKLIIPFTLIEIVFIWYNLIFQPHPPDILQARYSSVFLLWLARPTLMLIVTAIVSWLGSRSVERSILRADHAEELVAAERQLATQSRMLLEQQEQLKAEIAHILIVHREAVAGNYSIRAAINNRGMIWQVACSLNNLLARCQELARDREELIRTRGDIEKIADYIQQTRHGNVVAIPICHSFLGKYLVYAMTTSGGRTASPTQSFQSPGLSQGTERNSRLFNTSPLPPAGQNESSTPLNRPTHP